MHARPLIGYTGVTVVLVAALARLGRFAEPGGGTPAASLPFLALGLLGWTLGHLLRREPHRASLSRSLSLLGDALAGPCAWWLSLLLDSGGQAAEVRAAALGGAVFLAVAGWRLVREPSPDALHPYFVAAWGGLVVVLARSSTGLSSEAALWATAGLAILVAAAETLLSGPARPHAAVAAALLLAAGCATAAARLAAPSAAMLTSFHVLALALALWALARGEALGPLGRWLGGAAYAALTVAFTATLAYGHAPLALYLAATACWIGVLAVLAMALRSARLDPFRDSAAWIAALLSSLFTVATAPAWWPASGLPRVSWAAGWYEAAWRPSTVRLATAAGLAVVGVAAGALALFRRRHPSIAYSVGGLAANAALPVTLAYGGPLLVLLAACTAAGAEPWAPLAPLAMAAALLLAVWPQALGSGPACAGYVAVAAAAATASAGGLTVPVLVAGAGLLFARAGRTRALTPVASALAALTIAASLLSTGRPPAALAVALLALLALAAARRLLDREAESARTGAVLGWATLAAAWAIALAVLFQPWPLAGVLALWLGVPFLLAGRRSTGARTAYDPRLFVGEALETAALLVAHCAGAAALVLVWRRFGLAEGDAGPVLAGWAWVHLWLYRRLARRLPGRPATRATAIGSQTLALASLGLPLASSSLRIALATLLMNAALFFFWSDQPGSRARCRLLLVAGHVLNLAALTIALVEAGPWAPLALVASALVYLWRAQRTRSAGTHLAFLVTVTAAAGLALRTGGAEPAVWVPSLTAVGLLAVAALSEAASGRTVAVRLSWAWAVMLGLATVLGAASQRLTVARDFAMLWVAFLLAAELFGRERRTETVRPGEPEDEWLGLASHWVGHLAGGAALVAFCVVQGFGLGVAAAGLGAWAWLHWGIALSADERRTAGRALGHVARASAAAALFLAALAWRETGPASLACALAGTFALLVGLTAHDAGWRAVSALAVTQAVWIQGLAAGVTLREYYLTTAAACLYLVLRLRTAPAADGRDFLGGGAAARWRSVRAALLPVAILALAVGYPFVALLRDGRAVHLVCLGGGTGLVLLGFRRARQGRPFEAAVCVLLLGGALYAFATSGLDRTSAGLLLLAGLLVLANLLAGDAVLARGRSVSGRAASDVLPRGA